MYTAGNASLNHFVSLLICIAFRKWWQKQSIIDIYRGQSNIIWFRNKRLQTLWKQVLPIYASIQEGRCDIDKIFSIILTDCIKS
jgi:hypothetical protein